MDHDHIGHIRDPNLTPKPLPLPNLEIVEQNHLVSHEFLNTQFVLN